MGKRILAAALVAALGVGALGVAAPVCAGKRDNTLRIAGNQVPESLDSYFNNVRLGVIIAHHVWDHLIYRDPKTNEYKPALATSWKWVDEKTLEFELRRGVRFHNGEPFDADDVVYTFNFVSNPANKVVTQQNVNWIEKAEKLEPFKVRVRLRQPFPAALEYLAGPVLIYPNEYYAKVGPKGMSEKPVGSGPYKVVEHQPGRLVRFERNADYFKESPRPQPTIEKLELRLIPDQNTQAAELMGKGLDWIFNVPPDQAKQLKGVRDLTVVARRDDARRVAHACDPRQDADAGPQGHPRAQGAQPRHRPPGDAEDRGRRGRAGDPHALLPEPVRLYRRGRAALRLRPGEGEGAPRRGRLSRTASRSTSTPTANGTRPRR